MKREIRQGDYPIGDTDEGVAAYERLRESAREALKRKPPTRPPERVAREVEASDG